MVTRKPLPESPSVDDTNAVEPPRIEVWSATDSEVDSERIWGAQGQPSAAYGQDDETESTDASRRVPIPLRPGGAAMGPPREQKEPNPWDDVETLVNIPVGDEPQAIPGDVPNVLRPGVARSETNPFKRKPLQSSSEALDSNQRSNEGPAIASVSPAEVLSLPQIDEPLAHGTNPWQPALSGKSDSGSARTPPSLLGQDNDENVWDSGPQPKPTPPSLALPPSISNTESVPSSSSVPTNPTAANDILGSENAWEKEKSGNKGKLPAVPLEITSETIDGWNLVEHESTSEPVPGNLSKQSTWENFADVDADNDTTKEVAIPKTEEAPSLPPRTSVEAPPPQPPRRQSSSNVKSETYQIKNITWYDSKTTRNPRKSPILVQNANGPCPLVALVNALTLTTPADQANTNLVEALGSREQISLKFLLDVVVDELMSFRHTEANTPLPDMSELYAFLQGLHTGMNVNPRFIPAPESIAALKQTSKSRDSPSRPDSSLPGTFENTRDMELYATFKIPLIHGWLPPSDDDAYNALKARASSYDDAQNLLFHEEELEYKFSNSETGLTEEEQQLYQDIITIKSFLSTTATQLTHSGLDIITKSIKPGEVSILFRNDHFSTLYRHPQTLQLFTLVTDAGYYTHDEVVWESLADVRGERAEFFSGDFRVVGGNHPQRVGSEVATSNGSGWQTVQNRRSRSSRQSEPLSATTPLSPQHEQEDRDLALALQLQEEEEERHRAEQAARRRESRLSEQFIEQQGRDGDRNGSRTRGGSISSTSRGSTHSLPPPRGSSANQPARGTAQARGGRPVQQVRSLIPPRTHRPTEDSSEEAPPSYEQAARSTPYLPPAGHPSHPESDLRNQNPRRSSTLRSQANPGPSTPSRPRQPTPSVAAGSASNSSGKDRDCILM
ncbi:putative DUF544 domain protein [Rosellinia necatrix]|uniref:Putative DUF544 domain protein n=1 Tax=Rosellinia necatrix TaxID=77044 RepID=A0A1S7UKI9_ROSNE|nr:putative DUF544 domain protein [Rosellinia necatrix]